MRVCAFFVTCALAGASPASAQSLADVARKESERRQEATPTSKTYTNTDLKVPRRSAADVPATDGASGSGSPADVTGGAADGGDREPRSENSGGVLSDADADAESAKDRERADASQPGDAGTVQPDADSTTAEAGGEARADEDVVAGTGTSEKSGEQYWAGRMSRLREQLERNETYLNALQSRVNALTTDFVNRDDPAQRTQISGERQKAMAELERLERQIQADRKAIPELEEEARRAGIPAGWLR